MHNVLLGDVLAFLETLAPLALAESWDNVGLLVGRRDRMVARIMTCLTITAASAAEAIAQHADLIVTHHPLPFRPLARLTDDSPEGTLLLDLIETNVAVYSAHTAYDSAATGVNQQWAQRLGLTDIKPLAPPRLPGATAEQVGAGRQGRLAAPMSLGQLSDQVSDLFALPGMHVVGETSRHVERVGVACGSAAELMDAAIDSGCQAFITGEARFHACLAAEHAGIGLLLVGHYASERFAQEALAKQLKANFAGLEVWASQHERDPLVWRG